MTYEHEIHEDNLSIFLDVDYTTIFTDEGIGEYEFWGSTGCDVQMCEVVDDIEIAKFYVMNEEEKK